MYLDRSDLEFRNTVLSGAYVDKSAMISHLNAKITLSSKFFLISRPRRFGKTYAAKMLNSYYSKHLDSAEIFDNLAISHDPSYKKHLNKYNVFYIDMQAFADFNDPDGLHYLERFNKALCADMMSHFPKVFETTNTDNFVDAVINAFSIYKEQFVFIIDEWDFVLRTYKDQKLISAFINMLRLLFKSDDGAQCCALVYMTGVLPIIRYNTESALNNFVEYTMVSPKNLAPYFGFTEDEVKSLCNKHHVPFMQAKKWYDGYRLGDYEIYNPRAIDMLCSTHNFENYWSETGYQSVVSSVLKLNIDNVRDDLLTLLDGDDIRSVDFDAFNSDLQNLTSRDSILAYLVHLGYLACNQGRIYIPNEEIKIALKQDLKRAQYPEFLRKYESSAKFIQNILKQDRDAVAEYLEKLHSQSTSMLTYNSEEALRFLVLKAMFASDEYYQNEFQELPTGKGFADLVYLPKPSEINKVPALVIELKCSQDVYTTISQIHEKQYMQAVKGACKAVLLVGINYDKKTKKHTCMIEEGNLD